MNKKINILILILTLIFQLCSIMALQEPPTEINVNELNKKMQDLVDYYNENHALEGSSFVESCAYDSWFDLLCPGWKKAWFKYKVIGSEKQPVKYEYVFTRPEVFGDEIQCFDIQKDCEFTKNTEHTLQTQTKEAIKLEFNEKVDKYVIKIDLKQEYSLDKTITETYKTSYTQTYKVESGKSCRPMVSYLLIKMEGWYADHYESFCANFTCPWSPWSLNWKQGTMYTPLKDTNGKPIIGTICARTGSSSLNNDNHQFFFQSE